MLDLALVTAAVGDPLTRADAKAHLRVDHTAEDGLIDGLIATATAAVQDLTGRALLTQTWEMRLDAWATTVFLPRPPAVSITSVKYTPYGAAQLTLASTAYTLRTGIEPGQIVFDRSLLPADTLATVAPIVIRYVAGYGSAAAVPMPIRQAMLLLIGHWYANREAVNVGNIVNEMPFAVMSLLQPYRITWFGAWTE